eukprot:scaffold39505_cov33-Tisochrysis_lutea.AAC.2
MNELALVNMPLISATAENELGTMGWADHKMARPTASSAPQELVSRAPADAATPPADPGEACAAT